MGLPNLIGHTVTNCFLGVTTPVTEYKLFMHFNIHKSYSETFACLGLEIRLHMKKLQFKRWFYTVFQESQFDSVTWKTFNNIAQNWFPNKLDKFSQHSWNGMSYLKSNLWQGWWFASRQTATIPFEILQIVTVWHLLVCSEYPLIEQRAKDILSPYPFSCCKFNCEK